MLHRTHLGRISPLRAALGRCALHTTLALALTACAADAGSEPAPTFAGCAVPSAPLLPRVHRGAVLHFDAPGGARVQLGTSIDQGAAAPTTWVDGDSLTLGGATGRTERVFARLVDDDCAPAAWFDASYTIAESYEPAAGEPGSSAVAASDGRIRGWADGVVEPVLWGEGLTAEWQRPERALGPADGTMGVVSLGEGGAITLSFATPIADGPGADLAVFENAFADDFLELAWVEVSSDGEHFERFDSAYLGEEPIDAFGTQPTEQIGGLAGKYGQRFGTPFDLADLRFRAAVRDGALDLHRVTQVRIVDVVGDGQDLDSFGHPIYDPFPTLESAGFDLDAVGVLSTAR